VAEETVRVVDDPTRLDARAWNRLARGHPFLRHEFFAALHATGCATARTGWTPQFLLLERDGALAGAMPMYLKSHSYGEYVFDWAWADAYHRHGFEYYPKLLAAVPFSPISAPKLLAADEAAKRALVRAALALARKASSLHVLFPTPEEARLLADAGCMLRRGVQFHWENRGYADFDAFLATLSHDKRKKIKQERRKVREAGVTTRRLVGSEITTEDWRFFTRCYNNTYREHLSTPYLTRAFFERIGATLGDHLLLVVAERDGRPIASALDVFTNTTLYGRYWGSIEHVPALHFEACYYQAIEFAIERGVAVFEGGAQGEHKLARGFLPVETLSAHWLAHPEFADAVQRFLDRESAGVERYLDELAERAPFRRQD
jgi:predicted N-acyltransferase